MDLGELTRKAVQMQKDVKEGKDTGVPMIEAMVLTLVNKAMVDGDPTRFNFLLDRIIGPIEKQIKVIDDRPKDVLPIPLTTDEKLKMLDRYREKILDKGKSEGTIDNSNIIEAECRDITGGEDISQIQKTE